jgi:hypothetical protein
MRIIAATKILDEGDIVEAFARHTAHYVSHHFFLDNGSVDGTVEVLRRLRDEGLGITVLQNGSRWFNEAIYNTLLYFIAIRETAADWVAFLDADEFIDDRQAAGGLSTALAQTNPSASCVRVLLTNYHPSAHDDPNEPVVPVRIRWYEQRTDVQKVIVRGNLADRNVVIEAGGHGVLIDGSRNCPCDDLGLSHWRITLSARPSRPSQPASSISRTSWTPCHTGLSAMLDHTIEARQTLATGRVLYPPLRIAAAKADSTDRRNTTLLGMAMEKRGSVSMRVSPEARDSASQFSTMPYSVSSRTARRCAPVPQGHPGQDLRAALCGR